MTDHTCQNDTCGATFEPRRKDQRFCSPRCRETEKKRRQRINPEFAAKELSAQRLAYQAAVAEDAHGFHRQAGFEGIAIPPTPRRISVPDGMVIDYSDDMADLISTPHPLPRADYDEIILFADAPYLPEHIRMIPGVTAWHL